MIPHPARVQLALLSTARLAQKWFDVDPKPAAKVLERSAEVSKHPGKTLKFMIDNAGDLVVGEPGTHHIDIDGRLQAQGRYPVMAGRIVVDEAGAVAGYNNQSGHFQPQGCATSVHLTESVFVREFGNKVSGRYQAFHGYSLTPSKSGWRQISIGPEGVAQAAALDALQARKDAKPK